MRDASRDFWRRRPSECVWRFLETPSVRTWQPAWQPRVARGSETKRAAWGGMPSRLCERRARAPRPRVQFDRLAGRSRCPWRRPQMVPRTPRSIVRDCTIERGSSCVLNSPKARSQQACLPSCLINFLSAETRMCHQTPASCPCPVGRGSSPARIHERVQRVLERVLGKAIPLADRPLPACSMHTQRVASAGLVGL